jgi:hypothetical protein
MKLDALRIQNLRGFENAFVAFDANPILFVGPNNAGKTGIVRLLDWILNAADDALLLGERALSEEENTLLIPARSTKGRARRMTLYIDVPDRRRHRRFKAKEGVATLRVRVSRNRVSVNLGPPRRSEGTQSASAAVSLLRELRQGIDFILIPAERVTTSNEFAAYLSRAIEGRLRARAVHRERGGAPAEYRTVSHALSDIKTTLMTLADPLRAELATWLLPSMAHDSTIEVPLTVEALVKQASDTATVRMATGPHDIQRVGLGELGSGMQSLVYLSLLLAGRRPPAGVARMIAIEEPEAYLHPSAQRALARRLIDHDMAQVLATTHSSLFVDEAPYQSVRIVKGHRVFSPTTSNPRRRQINSALLTGLGSELPFCDSVLLVEGEGDRMFFETLRRHLAQTDSSGVCERLLAIPVGGKTRFGPWIRLVNSFRFEGARGIRYLVTADGVDAAADIRDGFANGGVRIANEIQVLWSAITAAHGSGEDAISRTTARFNESTRRLGLRVHLLPFDLEWAALEKSGEPTVRRIANRIDAPVTTRNRLLGFLGSKAPSATNIGDIKHPWMRAVIAEEIDVDEVSDDVIAIIRRWLTGAGISVRAANGILRAAQWKIR